MATTPPNGALEKRTTQIKTLVGETLFNDLNRLAAEDDRSLSDYVERVLRAHVYGHIARRPGESEGTNRD